MRTSHDLHVVYADASADPRLHGIARGLGQLFASDDYGDLSDEMSHLIARLEARDDWDGPDRDEE